MSVAGKSLKDAAPVEIAQPIMLVAVALEP